LDLRLAQETSNGTELDEVSSASIVKSIAKTLEAENMYLNTSSLTGLTESPRAWRIFRDSALARALCIDNKEAENYIAEIQGAIDERMPNGRLRPPEMQMKEMLEDVSRNAVKDPEVIR
jgi:hypothetical protein